MSIPADLDLLAGLPAPTVRPERERRLHAVEPPPLPRRRPRLVYGIAAVTGAVLIGAVQMGLSILSTQSSYQLATLTEQQRTLDHDKQALTDALAGLDSPQILAANAAALGMVTGQAPSFLRLSDHAIIGTDAGSNGASAINALSHAAVANELIAGRPLVSDPSARLSTGTSSADTAIAAAATTAADAPTPPAIADGLPAPTTH